MSHPAFHSPRWSAAAGALLAVAAIALSAYATHGADAAARGALFMAAAFAFGHALALTAVAPSGRRGLDSAVRAAWLLGTLLFAGSLAGAHFLGTPTALAPFGGTLTMLGWLLLAVANLRR